MKAVVVHEPGPSAPLDYVERAVPSPGPGQVLIHARYIAVNFADVKRRRAVFAPGMPTGEFVPGIELSGSVVAVGEQVTGLALGDQVVALVGSGGYAEFAVADARATFVLPPGIAAEQAGAFGVVGFTSFLSMTAFGHSREGDAVLITAAAGGVGVAAVQIARLLGLDPIIAGAGSVQRARTALGYGAHYAIDYGLEDLRAKALEATSDRGVDLVLDAYGGHVRDAALAAIAPGGRLVHFGNSSGEAESLPSLNAQREALITIVGFSLRQCRILLPDLLDRAAEILFPWVADGRLAMPIDAIFPLRDAARAHDLLESRQVIGKLLLDARDL